MTQATDWCQKQKQSSCSQTKQFLQAQYDLAAMSEGRSAADLQLRSSDPPCNKSLLKFSCDACASLRDQCGTPRLSRDAEGGLILGIVDV